MSALDDLLNEIFDGKKPVFYAEFEGWLKSSRRFKAFATTYQGKIRAKLRQARDDSYVKDLRAELQTAMLLLHDERFTLEYERYAAIKVRGPDLTVTFKTHTPFNVEVRRIRSVDYDDDPDARITKLMAILCDKVGQMPPNIINLLWLVTERDTTEADLTQAVMMLRQLADRKAEEFFTQRGFTSAAAFLRQFQQLSGIVLHNAKGQAVWLNPSARHKVPPDIVTALQRLNAS